MCKRGYGVEVVRKECWEGRLWKRSQGVGTRSPGSVVSLNSISRSTQTIKPEFRTTQGT